MKVSELMTKNPACVTPDADLGKVAKLMADHNVGAIPVVENQDSKKVVGVVTDRDIAIRAVAQGKNPVQMKAQEVMSTKIVTVKQDDDIQDVTKLMEKHQVRRVPVVDENGKMCGMVAQADIALKTTDQTTADVVQTISKPGSTSNKR
jgi:CBS domain-containing protein